MRHCFSLGALIFLIGLVGCQTTPSAPMPITLAEAGQTVYTIVEADQATEPEQFAAQELATFLGRVTGASYPVVKESAVSGSGPHIYVGWTTYAKRAAINVASLGEEEWIIRTIGQDLVLTGGAPRGTMYAVYEFLEDQVGCHWLDADTEIIPATPTLVVGPLQLQDKPWFWQRDVHSPTGTSDAAWLFMVRNKNYRYGMRGRKAGDFFPKGAFSRTASNKTGIHSFSTFVNGKGYFATHPEYFALVKGKRLPALSGAGPGQLCLTNPDVLAITIRKLRQFIDEDRAEAKADGTLPPKAYWITQNDVYAAHCECENCQAIVKREGGESGPLLEFINAVAKDIEADYPGIYIATIAYNQTSVPPAHIRPRDNVLIGWCDVYSRVDGIRPLVDPSNIDHYNEITAWGKVAPNLAIGDDYWTALSYYKYFPTPYSMIDCVASDLKLFADQGAVSFFAESGDYMAASQQFIPLKFWLAYQLLVDPHQPAGPLIQTFMDGYFGNASAPVHSYLRYMRQRINADAQYQMLRNEPHNLAYLDLPFFVKSQALFDQAEAAVPPDSLEATHIGVERFTLDGALLYLWPWLERKLPPGETMPFDHEAVITRYERGWKTLTASRYSRMFSHQKLSLNADGKLMERMTGLFRDPQLPEQFRDLPAGDVADFNWLTFSQIRPRQMFIPDEDAAGRMTAIFTEKGRIQKAEEGGDMADVAAEEQFRKPLTFGVTSGPTLTLKPDEIPQDGKYHLHKIGRIRVKPDTVIWALEGQRLGVNVDRLFVPGADNPAENDWNAYISLKLQGPAYVKGSTEPNGAFMDRVLLVRPQPGEPVSDAYRQQLAVERQQAAQRPRAVATHLSVTANGNPARVNWSEVSPDPHPWSELSGGQTERAVSITFAHDSDWLYVQLMEQMETQALVIEGDVWSGDDWELLLAAQRGLEPYRQLAVNPDGKYLELAYGEGAWHSGVVVDSQVTPDRWRMRLAFPLAQLLPGGAKPGQRFYVNLLRGGKPALVWSPLFGDRFHSLERFGSLTLE